MTQTLFIGLVVAMSALLMWVLFRTPNVIETRSGNWKWPVGFLVIYMLIPAFLAGNGVLDSFDSMPPPVLIMVLAINVTTFVFAFSKKGLQVGSSITLPVLVGFQIFRVPVELLLHRLYQEQSIPVVMTYSGWNFDIITGITAGLLGLWLLRRSAPKWVFYVWNILGLSLLINIVAIAIMAMPTPFQVLTDGPANVLPSQFPYVWLPTVLVQLALIGHLLLFRRLKAI